MCYMILAGKKATADGSVLMGHNNDLSGHNASLLERLGGSFHSQEEGVSFPSGCVLPQVSETLGMLILRVARGYDAGDAVAVNSRGVAVGGGVSLSKDRSLEAQEVDPLITRGLSGLARYVALERSSSARECVTLLGHLYSEYGVAYPSGVAVGDANEIWYLEAGGGRMWAALRLPDHACWVQGNGYRIGEISCVSEEEEDFLCSGELRDFVISRPTEFPQGVLDFAGFFGGHRVQVPGEEHFNARRVWRGFKLLGAQGLSPDSQRFPMWHVPQKPVTLSEMAAILRDYYGGTSFDAYPLQGKPSSERAIAVTNTVHCSIVQLRENMPCDVGTLLWAGTGSPLVTPLLPYYWGSGTILAPFGKASERYDRNAAFWRYRELMTLAHGYAAHIFPEINEAARAFETQGMELQDALETSVLSLFEKGRKTEALDMLTNHTSGRGGLALDLVEQLLEELHTRIAREGYTWIRRGEMTYE